MSTCNFITQEHFPLFAFDYDELPHEWACPDCSCDEYGYPLQPVILEDNGDGSYTCPRCGCTTSAPAADLCDDRGVDPWTVEDWANDIRAELEEVNADLQFWRVALIDGYFTGAQLVAYIANVETDWHMDRYRTYPEDIGEWGAFLADLIGSDEATATQWAEKERARVADQMRELAQYHGFREYRTLGTFSNGEAVYTEVI